MLLVYSSTRSARLRISGYGQSSDWESCTERVVGRVVWILSIIPSNAEKLSPIPFLTTDLCADAALSLARICLATNADLSLRQSAGINLKKYTREHWSIAFETFKGDPPSHEVSEALG